MARFRTLDDLGDLTGKVALVRVDLNLPMQDGSVTDDTRVRAAAPTILELAAKGAKVLLLAHFGRPKGERVSTMSVSMTIDAVQAVLGKEVMFVPEIAGPVVAQSVGILRPGILPCWRTPASGRVRKRTSPNSPRQLPPMAISMSTMPSRPRTAPMPAPKAWRTCCQPMPAGRWKPNSRHSTLRSARPSARLRPWWAGPRSRPSWMC